MTYQQTIAIMAAILMTKQVEPEAGAIDPKEAVATAYELWEEMAKGITQERKTQ